MTREIIDISNQEAGQDNRAWAFGVMRYYAEGRKVEWGTIELPRELDRMTAKLQAIFKWRNGRFVTAEVEV